MSKLEYRYFPIAGGWIAFVKHDGVGLGCCFIFDPDHTTEPVEVKFENIESKQTKLTPNVLAPKPFIT